MKGSLSKMALIVILIIAISAVVVTISFTVFYAAIMRTPAQGQPAVEVPVAQETLLQHDLGTALTCNLSEKGRYVQFRAVLVYPEIKKKVWFGLREEVDMTLSDALKAAENQIKDLIPRAIGLHGASVFQGDNIDVVKADLVTRINKLIPAPGIQDVLLLDRIVT